MKTSLFQRLLLNLGYVLLGISSIAVVTGAINDALALIETTLDALIGTLIILCLWAVLEFFVREYRPLWKIKDIDFRLKALGVKPRLAATGAVIFLWLAPLSNLISDRFRTPQEVLALPHMSYEFTSNYYAKYFRLKDVKPPLADELYGKVTLRNASKYVVENVEVSIYISCGGDYKNFLRPYYLSNSDYLLIGFSKFLRLYPEEKKAIDILEALTALFRSPENLAKVILPELRPQDIPKLNNLCAETKPSFMFTEESVMLQEEYIAAVPVNEGEAAHGFNGAMLKIIVEYNVNDIKFKELLVGGLYYKFIILRIPVPLFKAAPVGTVLSGFFKADYSLWKKKNKHSFSSVKVPQEVIDTLEDGNFQTVVSGPVQPGQEVTLRGRPDKAFTLTHGKFLPIPLYLYIQNNTHMPQPDNLKGLTLNINWKQLSPPAPR